MAGLLLPKAPDVRLGLARLGSTVYASDVSGKRNTSIVVNGKREISLFVAPIEEDTSPPRVPLPYQKKEGRKKIMVHKAARC